MIIVNNSSIKTILFLMKKYNCTSYVFKKFKNIDNLGLCQGVFFDFKREILYIHVNKKGGNKWLNM